MTAIGTFYVYCGCTCKPVFSPKCFKACEVYRSQNGIGYENCMKLKAVACDMPKWSVENTDVLTYPILFRYAIQPDYDLHRLILNAVLVRTLFNVLFTMLFVLLFVLIFCKVIFYIKILKILWYSMTWFSSAVFLGTLEDSLIWSIKISSLHLRNVSS